MEHLFHLRKTINQFFLLFALVVLVPYLAEADEKKSDKPEWFIKAERSLVGTWVNTNSKTNFVPKLDIAIEKGQLMIRIWGKSSPKDSPYGPAEKLHILSRGSDAATAFNVHKSDFAMKYHTLRLVKDVLHFQSVTIFTDSSGRSNRINEQKFTLNVGAKKPR